MATISIADYLRQMLGDEDVVETIEQRLAEQDPSQFEKRRVSTEQPTPFRTWQTENLSEGLPLAPSGGGLEVVPYANLGRQVERATLYTNPAMLEQMPVRGKGEREGLYDIARQMGIPGRSSMRKQELVQAIGQNAPMPEIQQTVAGMEAVDVTLLQSRLSPSAAETITTAMGAQRQQVYAQSQALYGFSTQNVDIALARAGLNWAQISTMSEVEVRTIVHGPVAQEFIARGGAREFIPPYGGEYGEQEEGGVTYFAPHALQERKVRIERGEADPFTTSGRLEPGAPSATLAQSWMMQRGRTPTDKTKALATGEFYRGSELVGQLGQVAQEPGIALVTGAEGQVTGVEVGDPTKAAKRVSQLAQEHGITFPGLPTVQSKVLGQTATIAETGQKAHAWLSMGEWMPQGAGLYSPSIGQATTQLTRRVRLPKGAEVTVKPGQEFAGGERIPVFGGHVGFDFHEGYEKIIVQQATPVQQYGPGGQQYAEIQFQALGIQPTGTLVAAKHFTKAGQTGSNLPEQMGVQMILPINELYQTGAMIQGVASDELIKEIWGEGETARRWGPGSGEAFVRWLHEKAPLEERLIPEQPLDLGDPATQKLLELGRLVDPQTGKTLTQETVQAAMVPGTKVISAQIRDVGLETDIFYRGSLVSTGTQSMVKPETEAAVMEQHPRLGHELFRGGIRQQAEMAHVLGSVAANVEPESEIGKAFIQQAVPASEIAKVYPQLLQKAHDIMRESGIEKPEDQPDVAQGLMMGLAGEQYKGRGLAFDAGEGKTAYFPNPQILARKFGYPYQEDVLNQLPRRVAGMIEREAQRGGEGMVIPKGLIPRGKTAADYTPEQLREMVEQYRTEQIGTARKELLEETSSKEMVMKLLGVSAPQYLIPQHPTATLGIDPNKWLTSERVLRKALVAPGATEEEREELVRKIQAGEIEGPRLAMAGYPIVDPGQVRQGLSYMTPGEAVQRGIARSGEEFQELYAGRLGVSQMAFAGQEKDLDVDEMLRLAGSKYVKSKETGEWEAQHLARASTARDVIEMATETAISGETRKGTQKIEERSSLEKVRDWIGSKLGLAPVPVEEFQQASMHKATGGITIGSMYNVFARRISARMGGHPEGEAARRAVATPYQTALDIKPVEGGWKNILERMQSFNIATKGYAMGEPDPVTGKKPAHFFAGGLSEYVDVTTRDVLGLGAYEGGRPLEAKEIASMLINPARDEESWKKLTPLVEQYRAATTEKERNRLMGGVEGIRSLVSGGMDVSTAEGMKALWGRSPVLGAGIEAGAWKAMEESKGTGIIQRETRTYGLGPATEWLAEKGKEMGEYIHAMSPLNYLEEKPSLYERFMGVRRAVGHPAVPEAVARSAVRAEELALRPPPVAPAPEVPGALPAGGVASAAEVPVEPAQIAAEQARAAEIWEAEAPFRRGTFAGIPVSTDPEMEVGARWRMQGGLHQIEVNPAKLRAMYFGGDTPTTVGREVQGEVENLPTGGGLAARIARAQQQREQGPTPPIAPESRLASLATEFRAMTPEQQAAYRARSERLDPNRDLYGAPPQSAYYDPRVPGTVPVGGALNTYAESIQFALEHETIHATGARQAFLGKKYSKGDIENITNVAALLSMGKPMADIEQSLYGGEMPENIKREAQEYASRRARLRTDQPFTLHGPQAGVLMLGPGAQAAAPVALPSAAEPPRPNQPVEQPAGGDLAAPEKPAPTPAAAPTAETVLAPGATNEQRYKAGLKAVPRGLQKALSGRFNEITLVDGSTVSGSLGLSVDPRTGEASFLAEGQIISANLVKSVADTTGRTIWGAASPSSSAEPPRPGQPVEQPAGGDLAARVQATVGGLFEGGTVASKLETWTEQYKVGQTDARKALNALLGQLSPKERGIAQDIWGAEMGKRGVRTTTEGGVFAHDYKGSLAALAAGQRVMVPPVRPTGAATPEQPIVPQEPDWGEPAGATPARAGGAAGQQGGGAGTPQQREPDVAVAPKRAFVVDLAAISEAKGRVDVGAFYKISPAGDVSAGTYPMKDRSAAYGEWQAGVRGAAVTQQLPGMPVGPAYEMMRDVGVGPKGPWSALDAVRRGKTPTMAQLQGLETEFGPEVAARAAELGGKGGATASVEKFSEALVQARGRLEKYGEVMEEQVDLFRAGKLKATTAWKADVREMVGTGLRLEQMAATGVPEEQQGEYGRWQQLMGQARGAGLVPEMGGGFGEPEAPESGLQGAGRWAGKAFTKMTGGFQLMMMRRLWGMTGAPVFNQFIPAAAGAELQGWGLTQAAGGFEPGLPEGVAGDLMRYEAGKRQATIEAGRAGYRAWGWAMQDTGALKQAQGVFGPAVGAGLLTGAGLTAMGVSGAVAGPIGLGVTAIASGIAGAQYLRSYAEPTAENQFTAAEGPWGRFRVGAGTALETLMSSTSTLSPVAAGIKAAEEQAEAGTALLTTPFEDMTSKQRMASYNELAQRLTAKGGRLEGMDEAQALEMLRKFAPFDQGLSKGTILTGEQNESWEIAARTGITPTEFFPLAQTLGLKSTEVMPMYNQVGRLSDPQRLAATTALGQYAGLTRFGVSGQDILRDVVGGTERAWSEEEGRYYTRTTPGTLPELGGQQAINFQALQQGGRAIWSQKGIEQGIDAYKTVSPESGMAIGSTWGGGALARQIISGRFEQPGMAMGSLSTEAFQRELEAGNIQINADEATVKVGGYEAPLTQVGLQDLATKMQREEQGWQREFQLGGMAAQYAYTTGRAAPFGGGEGAQFAAGGGMWGLEDQTIAAQRQHQRTEFGFQWEQLGLQDTQFYRRLGLGQQRMETQISWGREDMQRQYGRQMTQFGWAGEDLARQGATSTLHYAWGQEDLEESMRYATGRDRRKLMKQQERQTVDYAMQMGQLETEGGRLNERRRWAEEDFNRERQRFDLRASWQRQDMELSRRDHEEQMSLARRRLQESERYFNVTNGLQDKQRELSREYWEFTIQRQLDAIEHNKALAEQMNMIQDLLGGIAQSQQQQLSWFAAQFEPNGSVRRSWEGFVGVMLASINDMKTAASGATTHVTGNPYKTGR